MALTNIPAHKIPHIHALDQLGDILRALEDDASPTDPGHAVAIDILNTAIQQASVQNPWFTDTHCRIALSWWGHCLSERKIQDWLAPYPRTVSDPATIALIMAGNIPVVGFHDLICVLVTGHRALIKSSSKDEVLLPALVELLIAKDESIRSKVEWAEGPLKAYDGVIATGSNNTSRYFEYYFGKKPNIIRKNRNAIGVLTGNESDSDLKKLADDIFLYFGLGCRNISKIYLPRGFEIDKLIRASADYSHYKDHHKYANNYDYYKAVYLMGEQAFIDGEFCLFREEKGIASPLSTIYYEYYDSLDVLKDELEAIGDQIQCIVSESGIPGELSFGQAQRPNLSQYADGVDTVEFLLKTSFK